MKVPRSALRGIVPISGSYDLRNSKRKEYLPTPEAEAKASALLHVDAPTPQAIVAYGSLEERLKDPSAALVKALAAKGSTGTDTELDGKDHATRSVGAQRREQPADKGDTDDDSVQKLKRSPPPLRALHIYVGPSFCAILLNHALLPWQSIASLG